MGASATLPGPNGLIWSFAEQEPNAPVQYFGTYDLATKAIRKTNIQRVLTGGSFDRQVSFSGNGSLVAFVRASGTTNGIGTGAHIAVLPMTGGVPVDLTPDSSLFNVAPSFCGDGTIVFERGTSRFAFPPETGKVRSTLWAVSSTGGPARQLTSGGTPPATQQDASADKGSDFKPSCSQDGTIVFVRDGQIMKTTLAGGTPTVLQTSASSYGPDISPDGTRFVYGNMIAPVAGGPAQVVAGIGTDNGGAQNTQFSPDGKQLIYTRNIAFTTNRLYTLDLAASIETLQTTDTNAAQLLAWSPSPLTPMITAAPTYPVPTPTPTPTASPAPTQPSQATVLAALRSVGQPPKGATIAKLLAKGAAVLTFKAPSAGTLTVKWSAGSKAGATAAKSTPIAKASKTIAAAGATKIKIKLTRAGKKALRQAKRAKRALKVTSKAGFTPAGGTKTNATNRFKIRN